jgi:hypothetical protein
MKYSKSKEIEYNGQYWHNDADKVIDILSKELKDQLNKTRIFRINIDGTDFNDGMEHIAVSIKVDEFNNKIIIKEEHT